MEGEGGGGGERKRTRPSRPLPKHDRNYKHHTPRNLDDHRPDAQGTYEAFLPGEEELGCVLEDCEQGGGETHPDTPTLKRVSEKVLFQGAEMREGREGRGGNEQVCKPHQPLLERFSRPRRFISPQQNECDR